MEAHLNKESGNLQIKINLMIDYFISEMPTDVRDQLDYSPNSLDIVESWLLERYPHPPEDYALAVDDYEYDGAETDILAAHRMLHGAIFYIGEIYRRELRGRWSIYSSHTNPYWREFDNNPVIDGFYEDIEICPYFHVLEVIDEHIDAGGTLRSAFRISKDTWITQTRKKE
jgi:hypothetical protein